MTFRQQFGGYVFDPAIQRWAAASSSYYEYYKPNKAAARYLVLGLVFPIGGMLLLFNWERSFKEEQYTSGTLSYQDRLAPIDSFRV